jgi:hypothetical protein
MTRARESARLIGNNTFTINASNAVGVGSTTPDTKFDINGGLIVTGVTTSSGGFVGNLTGTASTSTASSTAYGISGSPTVTLSNATITGNLTVQGTTTILDTTVQEVDLLNIQANSSTPAIGVTQSGSGPIAQFYDGAVGVATFKDGGGLDVKGAIIASSFTGDGSGLTGVSAWDSYDSWLFGGG